MSAYAQNYAYIFGKKKPDAKENVVSKARMEEAHASVAALKAAAKAAEAERKNVHSRLR